MFSVAITYRPKGGRPLILATTNDHEVLSIAAASALVEAEQSAADLSQRDPMLGAIQGLELAKLRRVLVVLLTTMAESPALGPVM
jgi:hypothetical protein